MNKLFAFITLFILTLTSVRNVNSQLDDVAGGFLSGTKKTKTLALFTVTTDTKQYVVHGVSTDICESNGIFGT